MKLKGKAFWVFASKLNDMSGKYQMDLGRLSKAVATQVTEAGGSIKTEKKLKQDDPNYRGVYTTLKSEFPPKVVDAKNNPWPKDKLIGNGSTVNVIVNQWSTTNKFGSFTGLGLQAIQIVDLVPYSGGAGDETFDTEEGFEVTKNTEATTEEEFTEVEDDDLPFDDD